MKNLLNTLKFLLVSTIFVGVSSAEQLDCPPGPILKACTFPEEFYQRWNDFVDGSPEKRDEIIRTILNNNSTYNLEIKTDELIPPEILQDQISRNYIASLSYNNRKNFNSSDWQEHYDTNNEACRIYGQFRQPVQKCEPYFINLNLFRDNSRNSGFRYAYACITEMELSCPFSGCTWDPTKPVYSNIYVKKGNIMKADGRGIDENIEFTDNNTKEILKFPQTESITLRKCHSRSIYFATQVIRHKGEAKRDGYFAQSENAIASAGVSGDLEVRVERAWFMFIK